MSPKTMTATALKNSRKRLMSSEGAADGLYWPTDDVIGESPAGGSINQAELKEANGGDGYFRHRFKILTGQGDNIAGSAYDYIINGNMIAGFALIACSAKYAETSVNTFMVNQNGVAYEADLGPASEAIVKYIVRFNPDDSWEITGD